MTKVYHIFLAILLVFAVASRPPATDAAKILGLFGHPSESHFGVMRSVMKELARRQHNVTVYTCHRLNERVDNLTEIVIEPEYPFWREVQTTALGVNEGSLYQLSQLPASVLQKSLGRVGAAAADYFMSHAAVQQLLQLPPEQFDYDLVIVDLFYTEALLALGYVRRTPTIAVVSSNFENYMQHVLESVVPMACSPNDYETYDSAASGYAQRLSGIRDCMSSRKLFAKANLAAQEQLVNKHFARLTAAPPSMAELQSALAVLLFNNHVPLVTPRPLLLNTILAGGLHIRPARELPWNMRRFVDESRVGVIYINFGNEQRCAELPPQQLQLLFDVLGQRRERVVWTCHDVEEMEGLPKNFMLQHMVPQTDILAHPHIKVFIMNGELLSLQEGLLRHVPMLGVPLFSNELHNMALAVRLGVGIQLAYTNFTAPALEWALETLLYDSNYAVTIREVARTFRDRPLGALETAMYWVDYVLRHSGGAQIKTRGVGIPSSQLHLFDLFIFYFAMAVIFVALLVGIYYVALFMWKRQQVEKLYAKMN